VAFYAQPRYFNFERYANKRSYSYGNSDRTRLKLPVELFLGDSGNNFAQTVQRLLSHHVVQFISPQETDMGKKFLKLINSPESHSYPLIASICYSQPFQTFNVDYSNFFPLSDKIQCRSTSW
jgi:hypothetical protein